MQKANILLILILFFSFFSAQSESNAEANSVLLMNQVQLFNHQDVVRMTANVTKDFKYFYFMDDQLMLQTEGKKAFAETMTLYFGGIGKPQSRIESITPVGNKVSFREVVEYINKDGNKAESVALGVYEFKENKIHRAWYFVD